MRKPDAGEEVTYTGACGVRLVGERWKPGAGHPSAGIALLLHGGGQTRHSWHGTAARLAAHGWIAITVDARGHGDSQWAPDGDYSLDAFAGDLYAIAGTLDRAPVLIGASLGGMTALVGQGERPTLARALVLVDIAPRVEPAGSKRIRAFMASAPNGFASLEEVADAVHAYNPNRPRPRNLDGLMKNVHQHTDGRWYWHWDPKFLRVGDEPSRAVDTGRLYRAAGNITVPTLLVRGTRSDIVTPEAAAELLRLIPTATAVEVAAGHMIAGDDNDVFTAHLLDFLTGLADHHRRPPPGRPEVGSYSRNKTHSGSGVGMSMLAREEDETLNMFRSSVGRFLDRHATPGHLERWRATGVVDAGFWRLAGEAGLLSPSVPEEYGGAGADFRFEMAVIEEIGRRGLEGFGAPVHSGIVTPYLVHFATEEQKHAWLPKVVSGDIVLAIAMTEPGAGSDLKGIRTRAVRVGDHYVIDGQKTFISNGQTANLIVVACKTAEKGLSLFAIETSEAEGFQRGRNLAKVGREAQDTSELFFEGVRVPAANLLGGVEGQGFAQMTALLVQERIVIATMAQVMMERAVDLTVEYTKERNVFGKRLFDFQNTQFKLAECRTQATVGRTFLNDAVAKHLAGTLDATTAAMVKLWISETEFRVIDHCLQLFGGFGYMDEYPISRLFRDARIDRIHGGTSEIMKMIIARSL